MTSRADEWILRAADAWVRLFNRRLVRACRQHFGHLPDFARPRGHDALMQWRKVFDHNPLFVTFCDKLAAREWARTRIPSLGMSELIWTGPSIAALPAGFPADDQVLKVNSGTGSNYFPGRGHWDDATVRKRFRHWLRWPRRGPGEWAYDQVPRCLMLERLIGAPADLIELTFRCQDGEIASAFLAVGWKTSEARGCYLTSDGAGFRLEDIAVAAQLLRPELFERAAAMARQLGRGLDHVRVDFYLSGDAIFFGELTAYSSSGFGEEEEIGVGPLIERSWLGAIEKSWFLSTPQPWPMSLYQGAFRRWLVERRRELDDAPPIGSGSPPPAARLGIN